MSILPKPSQIIGVEETLLSLLYDAAINLMPKPDKDTTTKLQTNTHYQFRCKNPQQNTSKPNPAAH